MVAIATAARSPVYDLLVLFGLPAVFLTLVLATGVDAVPAVVVAVVVGTVVMMGLAVVLLKRMGARYVVGLTPSRLLVARVVNRSWLRIESVLACDRETLYASGVRARYADIESTNIHLVRGRLKLGDSRASHELDFFDATMPGNLEAFRTLNMAIKPPSDAQEAIA